jgi:hemerythrin-like metal-binding protein
MNSSAQFGRMQLTHFSLANLIRFGDHLFVEHPALDAQHKAIFDLGTGVYEDWRCGGSMDVLRPVLEKLTNLMHTHFSFEERVLHEIGYEDLKNHAAEHRRMRDELSTMHDQFPRFKEGREIRGGSLLAPGWSIMQFILGFTVGHVASCDMSYNRALIASRDQSRIGA